MLTAVCIARLFALAVLAPMGVLAEHVAGVLWMSEILSILQLGDETAHVDFCGVVYVGKG